MSDLTVFLIKAIWAIWTAATLALVVTWLLGRGRSGDSE